jgi:uncharacterized protein
MDVLRGFALCGILLVNIQQFSMIMIAGFNPSAYGDLSGLNMWVWKFTAIFGLSKFMNIFSLMYGAGIALLTSKIEAKGLSARAVHYRRTLILVVVGALHGYLLWSGDVLYWYGMCALIVYLFRRMSPRKMLMLAIIFLILPSALMAVGGMSMPYWPPEQIEHMREGWQPGPESVQEELDAYRGSWMDQMSQRAPTTLSFHTFVLPIWAFWRVSGLMLIGMAFFKWGVITAQRSTRFYSTLMILGLALGLPLVIFGLQQDMAHNWAVEFSKMLGTQYNYWGGIGVSLGYIGAVMLATRALMSSAALRPLAATGRMAFTNYIMQTLICTTIFYGHGFGLFGSVERKHQILIVVAIWVFQLIVSPIWLKHFRFGPLEWAWRSLSYRKRQPFKAP